MKAFRKDKWLWFCIASLLVLIVAVQIKSSIPSQPVLKDSSFLYQFENSTDDTIIDEHTDFNIDRASSLLVDAIIQIESLGNPNQVGPIGERGLMQLRKITWNDMTKHLYGEKLSFDEAFDPNLNREVGISYLIFLQEILYRSKKKWKSDLRSLLLASYNAGPRRVAEADFDITRLSFSVRNYVRRGSDLHDALLEKDASSMHRLLRAYQTEM